MSKSEEFKLFWCVLIKFSYTLSRRNIAALLRVLLKLEAAINKQWIIVTRNNKFTIISLAFSILFTKLCLVVSKCCDYAKSQIETEVLVVFYLPLANKRCMLLELRFNDFQIHCLKFLFRGCRSCAGVFCFEFDILAN